MRDRLLPAHVCHHSLVDAQHLAEKRWQAVEQALRHVSVGKASGEGKLEVRVRAVDEHLKLATRNDFD